MIRPRLAPLALAAGLGLVAGCSSDFSFRSMFSHRGTSACADGSCCPTAGYPVGDVGGPGCPGCVGGAPGFEAGPILPEAPPGVPPPPPVLPQSGQAPRVVPIPATPMPYTPG